MDNKKNSLFKNTIALYIRMLFSVCVNIYISRVVLDVLGVDDFGIYSIVGGVVALLGFINSSMSGSTSRFLSIALGGGIKNNIIDTYNAAKHLHIAIAILIFVLSETIGLWIVNTYLNIPPNRLITTNWLYQLSILTTLFSIIQVPYTAMIISMERMDVYAKIEILCIMLKLGVVIVLMYYAHDRLLMYGVLLLLVGAFIFFVYKKYCKKAYCEFNYSWEIKIQVIKPMLYFSCWDLLGWGGVSLSTQGRQIFINRFFDVSLNAANGMATTASVAINTFTNNVVMAFRPRIIKCYAAGDFDNMQKLVEVALLVVIILMTLIIVPMYYSLDYLLDVWLVSVPDYTLEFCRLLIVLHYIEVVNTVIKIGIHASAKMRVFTIVGFLIHLSNLVLTYALYKMGFSVTSTYIAAIILAVINVVANLILLVKVVPQINISQLLVNMLKGIGIGFICFLSSLPVFIKYGGESLLTFILVFLLTSLISVGFSFYYFRQVMKDYLMNNFYRHYKRLFNKSTKE